MPIEPDRYSAEDDDQPFSRWEDIKQRFLESLWYDIQHRTIFLFGIALMVVGSVGTVLFE